MQNGIDISKWQGKPDWAKLAAEHKAGRLDFVIMRAGYGGGTADPCFEANCAAARAAGIPVGAYWYAYWGKYTPAQEAAGFLRTVAGKVLEYGIWYDVEYEPDILALSKAERTDRVLEGLAALAASGRYAGLYASTDMINNRLEYERLRAYDIWAAQYGSVCTCKLPYGIWQYTSNGSINGIAGRVDCDRAYKDYPAFVVGKLAGLPAGTAGGTNNAQAGEDKPAESLPPAAPDGSRTPRGAVTRRYGPMSRGDLLRVFERADELGLCILGELTVGPASAGDNAALQELAAGLGLDCSEAG